MKELTFEISLESLRFFARHGVLDFEREAGNEFIVDLSVKVRVEEAVRDDELNATVSYAELFEIIKEEMEKPRRLLEKVALEIAFKIKSSFPAVESGKIEIKKVRPPVASMIGSASVSFEF